MYAHKGRTKDFKDLTYAAFKSSTAIGKSFGSDYFS